MDLTELIHLLRGLGSDPSGEADGLSALDHGLQCAWELAQRHPADVELQVAGLVHDVGHTAGGDEVHGRLGAEMVRPALGERVAALVEAHVPAKRYLVAADPAYRGQLSSVSTGTLALQGGPLNAEEMVAFEASTHFDAAVELRRADEAAKMPGRSVPGLARWLPTLGSVAP